MQQLSLKGRDQYKSMKFVIAAGVAIIAGLYATVGISGYVMFGERTKGGHGCHHRWAVRDRGGIRLRDVLGAHLRWAWPT
jgi:hypothetical protein